MKIKVLGTGCPSCKRLLKNVNEAVENVDKSIEVDYITDIKKIISMGVMGMPALVINDKVVSSSRVLNPDEIIELIKKGE